MSRLALLGHKGAAPGSTYYTYDTSVGNGVDSSGFASLPLRPTTAKRIYLASDGNDANNGLSHAQRVATSSRAMALYTDGVGDQILVAQGSTFATAPPNISGYTGGFSAVYPTVIQSYDPADPTNEAKMGRATGSNRPVFNTFIWNGGTRQSYVAVRGLDFNPGNISNQANNCIDFGDYILFENNLFRYGTLVVSINLQPNPGKHWTFRNNAFYGAYISGGSGSSGLYMVGGWLSAVEDNVFYHCGWKIGVLRSDASDGATHFSHSIYQQHSSRTITRRNLFIEGAADGGSHRDDTIIQNNVYINNPIHISAGGGNGTDAASPFGDALDVSMNAILGGVAMNSTGTDAYGWGIDTENGKAISTARYNVLANSNATPTLNHSFSVAANDGIPSYMKFDHNVAYQFSVPDGTTTGSTFSYSDYAGGAAFAQPTYTNNIWDNSASGSNTNISTHTFPNASLTVTSLATGAGYADETALANYAIAYPEQRIQRGLYSTIMAAFGVSTPGLIDLAIGTEAWRTSNIDCGAIVGTQDGTTLTIGGTWPTGFSVNSDKRFWFLDGTASSASSGTGTIIETKGDGSSRTTSIAWSMGLAPILSAASVTVTSSTAATLHVTTTIGNGTLYWVLIDDGVIAGNGSTRSPYPGEVKAAREYNYDFATPPGSRAKEWANNGSLSVTASGVQTINVSGLTPGHDYYFCAMQVSGAGTWSPTVDGLHAITPVHFVPA
jgi:hypothetical protein